MATSSRTVGETDLPARARAFAAAKHAGQVRKHSPEPYIVHLDSVVAILRTSGIDAPTVLAAAYLHDTVEDTDATMQDIYDQFGEDVAELVCWLTDVEQGKRKMRKIMSAWRLARAPWNAKLIKLADLIDNSEDICRHERHFAPVYLREKAMILAMMARAENSKLPVCRCSDRRAARTGPTQAEGSGHARASDRTTGGQVA